MLSTIWSWFQLSNPITADSRLFVLSTCTELQCWETAWTTTVGVPRPFAIIFGTNCAFQGTLGCHHSTIIPLSEIWPSRLRLLLRLRNLNFRRKTNILIWQTLLKFIYSEKATKFFWKNDFSRFLVYFVILRFFLIFWQATYITSITYQFT